MNETRPLHAEPLHAEPAATYRINPPSSPPKRPPAPWPLAARLALGVIIAALAAGLALSLVTLRSVSATASRAERQVNQLSRAVGAVGQDASQNGGSVTSLRSQLSAVEAQLGSIATNLSHNGVCLRTWTDNNGHVSSVELNSPVISGGNDTCPAGVFVSVVPQPGN